MATITSGELEGKKVFAQQGREIGVVHAVDVDTTTFRVRSLEIKLKRELLDELTLKVPLMGSQSVHLDVKHVQAIADAVMLVPSLDELRALVPGGESKP